MTDYQRVYFLEDGTVLLNSNGINDLAEVMKDEEVSIIDFVNVLLNEAVTEVRNEQ